MASTGFKEVFSLTDDKINRVVTKVSPGTYVLGHLDNSGTFIVSYVGRSDENLNQRLHSWVGKKNYNNFKASYFSTPKEAFDKECIIYHDFNGHNGKLDNDIHPDRFKNKDWSCPICDIFD